MAAREWQKIAAMPCMQALLRLDPHHDGSEPAERTKSGMAHWRARGAPTSFLEAPTWTEADGDTISISMLEVEASSFNLQVGASSIESCSTA